MGLFSNKKEAALLEGKTFREVAIVVSYTPASELDEEAGANFGAAVFKAKRNGVWKEYKTILREDFGALNANEQWIVKFDEDFTRVVTPCLKLSKNSEHRISED